MREEIIEHIKCKGDADVSVFSEAQHQVYTLMHRDSYPRFLASPKATEIIDALLGTCHLFCGYISYATNKPYVG